MGSNSNKAPIFFIFIFFFFFFVAAIINGSATELDNCSEPMKCGLNGPEVRFPFRLKGVQPDHCGYPGFDLSCDSHRTLFHLPFSKPFFVKTINYSSQTLHLQDPDDCTPQRLLHLNLSIPPFVYGNASPMFTAYNLTFLNCSSSGTRNYEFYRPLLSISCLSSPEFDFFAGFESVRYKDPIRCCQKPPIRDYFLSDCEKIKTVLYVRVGDIYSFWEEEEEEKEEDWSVILRWVAPDCGDCELQGKGCRLKNRTTLVTECSHLVHPPKDPPSKLLIIGLPVGFSLLMLTILTALKLYHMHNLDKIEKENQVKIEKFLEDYKAFNPTRYSYADIKRITNQFKQTLGQGGYGTVFKGTLSSEIEVAVKMLDNSQGNGEEFINEVSTIGRIHHVNVVRLVGFCADGYRRALVYEFMPNDSLEKYIFSRNMNSFLGWEKLQDIAVGIAKGIEYLHQGCDHRILHFDIKPHNILLDQNFTPKISDFGLAKLCLKGESIVSMSAARGTIGYIAPEVLSRNFGNVSYKSDVYSFGMLLLEMVGGRKNIDTTVINASQVYFPEWAYKCLLEEGRELEIITVGSDGDEEIAKKLSIVGLWCIQWYSVDRPSMKVVVQMLEGQVETLVMPPNPFASTGQPHPTSSANAEKNHLQNGLSVIPEQDELI